MCASWRGNFEVISFTLTFFVREGIFFDEVVEFVVASTARASMSVWFRLLFVVRVEDGIDAL